MHPYIGAALIVATIGAAYSVVCRLAAMHGPTTPPSVRHQHALLLAGLVMSLVLPGPAGQAALAVGVLTFLALSAHRWRGRAPWEHSTPPVPSSDWARINPLDR